MEQKQTFEQSLARLEAIVKALETGTAPLDESLSLFEEGVSLVRVCTGMLENAEQKVKLLTVDGNGEVHEQDFGNAD